MIRPVWHSPMRSETDSSDHLQSDVMRFMAILAFCLVAIFALVQSLPLQPANVKPIQNLVQNQPAESPPARPEPIRMPPPAPEPAKERETVPEPAPEPAPEPVPEPEMVSRPEPIPVRSEPPVVAAAPAPVRPAARPRPPQPAKTEPRGERPPAVTARQAPRPPVPQAVPRPAEPQPSLVETATPKPEPQEGFLLRFATDNALLALVAQRRVEVFGWTDEQAWRLSSQRGLLEFTPANAPRQFHEMAAGTVPAAVTAALDNVAGIRSSTPLSWGVTLPPDMSRQLQRLLREHDNGTLLIHADGRVRLESKG